MTSSSSSSSSCSEVHQRLLNDQFLSIKATYEHRSDTGATVWVNGKRIEIPNGSISAEETVLDFLRLRLLLTSSKLGCGEGGCGACTVMVSQFDDTENKVIHRSVNGCLTPILSLHGAAITTSEGICSNNSLHPIQRLMSDTHGSQCGFCTPGIVMSLYSKFMEKSHSEQGSSTTGCSSSAKATPELKRLTVTDIEDALDGNLCRCTGYRPIVEGFMQLTKGSHHVETSEAMSREGSETLSTPSGAESTEAPPSSRVGSRSLSVTSTVASESEAPYQFVNGSMDLALAASQAKNRKRTMASYEGVPTPTPSTTTEGDGGASRCPPTPKSVATSTAGEPSQQMSVQLQKSIEWLIEHEMKQEELGNHLRLLDTARMPLYFKARHLGRTVTWITPTSLKDLLTVMEYHRVVGHRCKLLHGNTERHIERVYKRTHQYPMTLVSTTKVHEFIQFEWKENGVRIGSSYPVNRIAQRFKERLSDAYYHDNNARILTAYVQQIRWFAGCQIRNVACLGGNIATASPISDLNPLHLAAGVVLTIARLEVDESSGTLNIVTREKPMLDNFFQGYRRVDLQPTEIIVSVFIPLTHSPHFHLFGFKQSRRREDDIAIVNAGMSVLFEDTIPDAEAQAGVPKVKQLVVSYGGMAPMTIALQELMSFWNANPWNLQTLLQSIPVVQRLTELAPDTPGGQVNYRMRLARNFYFKFFFQVAYESGLTMNELKGAADLHSSSIHDLLVPFLNDSMLSSLHALYPLPHHPTYLYHKEPCKGLQHFGAKRGDLSKCDAAGESSKHMAGDLHVTGKAIYLDDMPCESNELHAFLLSSTEAHARIVNIDLSECDQVVGFVGFVGHHDVQGNSRIGAVFQDEDVFAKTEIHAVGQPIGVVLAQSHEAARDASARIRIQYEKLDAILTLEDAIQQRSFFPVDFEGRKQLAIEVTNRPSGGIKAGLPPIEGLDGCWAHMGCESTEFHGPDPVIGDVPSAVLPHAQESKCGRYVIVSGGIKMGGQEHFYLETQTCRVVPSENDELTVFCSTQDPAKTQSLVATVTGIPKHKIVSKCKRMGGGFGGKETRSSFFAAYIAVAAQKFKRPVRMALDRDVDFQCSGQRHTFLSFYRVAIEKSTKKFIAADLQLFNDAGWSTDLSVPVMERALFHCENSYYFPNFRTIGRACKTNLPSNTAFRGFGGPQGMFVAETYVEHCAAALGCHPDEIREANFYKPGDFTHYKYPIQEPFLHRMWKELKEKCDYEKRRRDVEEFNRQSLWVKRGIRIIPVKFGMSFTKAFMNQAGSLVHVYTDGTVLVSHTGTEMGQGLHTKIAQVAATVFNIPIDSVYISETATDKVPNGMPTAASSGTDLNGMATLRACNQILERLESYIRDERKARKLSPTGSLDVDDEVRKDLFKKAAFKAHMDRINLSANGFYATPDINYSFLTNTGKPFHYFAYAMACTEVEVDTLTGDHTVVRADLLEDTGASLNPAIDIGQIEGGFVQGLGLFTLEEIITMPNGTMFTRGPAGYKIPAFGDIPTDFRVTLLEGVKNPAMPSVYSSKGVGEPPVFLASSAFFAIRDAIESKRLDLLSSTKGEGVPPSLKVDEALFPIVHNQQEEEEEEEVFNEVHMYSSSSNNSIIDLFNLFINIFVHMILGIISVFLQRSVSATTELPLPPSAAQPSSSSLSALGQNEGQRNWFLFHSPATSERICNACHRD